MDSCWEKKKKEDITWRVKNKNMNLLFTYMRLEINGNTNLLFSTINGKKKCNQQRRESRKFFHISKALIWIRFELTLNRFGLKPLIYGVQVTESENYMYLCNSSNDFWSILVALGQ